MWSAAEVFSGLLPSCGSCGAAFDARLCSPQVLPCAHTFCLMCLKKEGNTKKKKCLQCAKKYSSYKLNDSLAETVNRVAKRRVWLEEYSSRCDECDSRRPMSAIRRCLTCEQQISQHISAGLTMECSVCLECCVERHNGHQLINVNCQKNRSSDMVVLPQTAPSKKTSCQPLGCSTPRLGASSSSSVSTTAGTSSNGLASPAPHHMRQAPKSFRLNRIHLPITPESAALGGVVCEESSVYQSVETPNGSRSRTAGWMNRLTSLARRWSSDSSDGDSRRSSGLGTDDGRIGGNRYTQMSSRIPCSFGYDPKFRLNRQECLSSNPNYVNDHMAALSGRKNSRLHYVNVVSRSLDCEDNRGSTETKNRSYEDISA